jgi:phosphomethylpyrimidine synthase
MHDVSNYNNIFEVTNNIVSRDSLKESLAKGETIIIGNKQLKNILVGKKALTKINLLLGVSHHALFEEELSKILAISELKNYPDIITDLSISNDGKPLYELISEHINCVIGSVPIYRCFNKDKGVDPNKLVEEFIRQAEAGVSLFTLHLTPSKELFNIACQIRQVPCTSRGGGIVTRDLLMNNRRENVILLILPQIMKIAKQYNLTFSIGTSFRPSNIMEALDEVHLKETFRQIEYANFIHNAGINVIIEAPGHCSLPKIEEMANILKKHTIFPIMPLGPIPTDAAISEDHIAATIGVSLFGYFGCADVIAPITREEHTGHIPSKDSILEALRAARVAAHSLDIGKVGFDLPDKEVIMKRKTSNTCCVGGGLFDYKLPRISDVANKCDRCSFECPLDL